MPWSDWQGPIEDDQARGPLKAAITRTDGFSYRPTPGDAATQIDEARAAAATSGAGATTQIVNPFAVGNGVAQQVFNPMDPPDPSQALATATLSQRIEWYGLAATDARPSLPDPLLNLEEGVDYALRPDRDGSERDAYVEWEDGLVFIQPDDVTGWMASVTATVAQADKGGTPGIDGQASIYHTASLALPSEAVGQNTTVPVLPAGGSHVIGVLGPTDTTASADISMPGGTTQWQFVLEPSFTPFGYTADFYNATFGVQVQARVQLRYPRWRYWVPGGLLPLRQRQRDDGLGLSTARWSRGRSRQSSNRWRGYR